MGINSDSLKKLKFASITISELLELDEEELLLDGIELIELEDDELLEELPKLELELDEELLLELDEEELEVLLLVELDVVLLEISLDVLSLLLKDSLDELLLELVELLAGVQEATISANNVGIILLNFICGNNIPVK